MRRTCALVAFSLSLMAGRALTAQNPAQPLAEQPLQRETLAPAPNRASGEGAGPFKTLVIRGAMLIDGTGGPPRGPVDIVVSGNRITQIRNAGTPGVPLRPNRPPPSRSRDRRDRHVRDAGIRRSPCARRWSAEKS